MLLRETCMLLRETCASRNLETVNRSAN